jgi:hypothetical protein
LPVARGSATLVILSLGFVIEVITWAESDVTVGKNNTGENGDETLRPLLKGSKFSGKDSVNSVRDLLLLIANRPGRFTVHPRSDGRVLQCVESVRNGEENTSHGGRSGHGVIDRYYALFFCFVMERRNFGGLGKCLRRSVSLCFFKAE